MNLQSFICGAGCRRLALVVIFASLVYRAVSEDAQYEACAPRSCGYGPNISYPFWISGEPESYCGHPNFEITCVGTYPVLNFSDSEFFYIKEIFYANHSILLVDAPISHATCGSPRHNISFERTPFNLSSTNVDFLFYYNCTSQLTDPTYPVDCASNSTHHSFAFFPEEVSQEIYLNSAISTCDSPVSVPVNANISSLMAEDYLEIMEMGFLLNWTAINCSNCEESEGRCGFENNTFVCFCQDDQTCNDGKCMSNSVFIFLTESAVLLDLPFLRAVDNVLQLLQFLRHSLAYKIALLFAFAKMALILKVAMMVSG
ncbi:hypothetical protein ACJRO7_009955 [Eucalyptus globulus]|uniref:non-specific serine/threonine protein kinase n=1 Tax=Eucalyptus globulus TaxID=34317 RepID=A0ABD3LAI1_EUCGL